MPYGAAYAVWRRQIIWWKSGSCVSAVWVFLLLRLVFRVPSFLLAIFLAPSCIGDASCQRVGWRETGRRERVEGDREEREGGVCR